MAQPATRAVHDLIIARPGPSPEAPEVLLLRAAGGWRLPRIESEERRAADVAPLNRAARERLGLDISILSCLRDAPADPTGLRWQVSEAEWHGGRDRIPPDGAWTGAESLETTALAVPAQRDLLQAWRVEGRARASSRERGGWTISGWRDLVTSWAEAELRRAGVATRIVEVEQLRAWEFSCVLRLRTDTGDFFLKALPPSSAAETRLTRRLAETHPRFTPPVVAVDPERGWLLTQAVVGASLMRTSDLARWTGAAEACARIQIEWLAREGELTALGCPSRSLEWLEREIAPLLEDRDALLVGSPDGLDEAGIEQLRRRAPLIEAACRRLAGYGLPPALEHGDLWAENVVAAPGRSVLIDWEDAALAHPFFSPSLLLLSLGYTDALADVPEAHARIRDAYLAPWRGVGPPHAWPGGRLEAAFDLAGQVAMLYYAVQFRRFALPRIETSWEVRTFVPFFAHRLLETTGPA